MKPSRDLNREIQHATIPHKQRTSIASGSVGITKRREDRANKENNIQITEPLQSLHYPSKEFILSRESLNRNSRVNLREISQNQNSNIVERPVSKKTQETQQEIFDRRLSLKCTKTLSQQLDSQKSHRLSVAPERRDSMTSNRLPHSLLEDRDSASSYYQNSVLRRESKDSKGRPDIKKEAIITNLMNKLDHEEDLRSIIESKLKGGLTSSQCYSKDKRNQSYITDFTQQTSNVGSKLRQCENQLRLFKSAIKQMSQKILELTAEERNFKKKEGKSSFDGNHNTNELAVLLQQLLNVSSCGCEQRVEKRSVAVQTNECTEPPKVTPANQSFDFFDNLEKTLKVLDGKRT